MNGGHGRFVSLDGKPVVNADSRRFSKRCRIHWRAAANVLARPYSDFVLTFEMYGGEILVMDADDERRRVAELTRHDPRREDFWDAVTTSDGRFTVSCSRFPIPRVDVWETASGRCIRSFVGDTSCAVDVDISDDGKVVVASELDGDAVHVWDATTGVLIAELQGYDFTRVCVSADGSLVGVVARSDRSVLVFDARTGREIARVPAVVGYINAIAVSQDNKRMAVTFTQNRMLVIDGYAGIEKVTVALLCSAEWDRFLARDGDHAIWSRVFWFLAWTTL